jgi:hypothetical protein
MPRGVMDIAISKNRVAIRLTDERWAHISEEHAELAEMRQQVLETITTPERVYLGEGGEMLAAKEAALGKSLVVVYREMERDGFVITAFLTRRMPSLRRRKQLWP